MSLFLEENAEEIFSTGVKVPSYTLCFYPTTAFVAVVAKKNNAHTHTHPPTHTHTHTHTHTPNNTHTHTHTQNYLVLFVSGKSEAFGHVYENLRKVAQSFIGKVERGGGGKRGGGKGEEGVWWVKEGSFWGKGREMRKRRT